ncbi:MAG: helicase-related protein [Syntrophales bacterium]|jgi:superfamily II DNA or RNA helicase|nr:helicase-related protein [Syntrophales bacterium]
MTDAPTFTCVAGDVVSGLEPDDLVEISRVAPFGSRILVEGVGIQSRRLVKRPLTQDELSQLIKIRGSDHSFDGDASLFLLGAEAERIRIAHQFDPLFAVNASIVDPLPHQVEAVYRYLLPLPRIRFLLADDTGAGKTIMTGLLIKELLFRGVIQKVLIITPGGLTKQWQEEEMQEKFGLTARLVNRASFDAEPGQFSSNDGIFVISIDFLARNEGCLNAVENTPWDMVVVDEAHKLSAYEYGTKLEESGRYKAVKAIADKTDHLLFLTATPHRGRKDTFRRLLLLLDQDLFQKDEHVSDKIQGQQTAMHALPAEDFEGEKPIAGARNRFFLRRLKEEMVDWDSTPLFKERHTKTIGYDLTPEEKILYDEVTGYVRTKRREAKAKKNRNVELTLMVMQRRLASSIYAITRTLGNRLNALNEILSLLADPARSQAEKKRLLKGQTDPDDPLDISEYEDLPEDERERTDQRIFRQVLTDDPQKIEEERDEIERLCRLAEGLKHHKEAKLVELLSVLDSSDIIRADDEKLLIFTEHRDTLNSLAKRLEDKGYTVITIHGGMDVDSRKAAQRQFRMHAKIMIATDAAGEGVNLQFCRYMINWDIPWNPNRLEQRMGRIHRYGQKDDVWVYNLVARNTREGAVLEKILSKMDVMRDQMGSDRVYDVIDELLEDVPLLDLMEKAIDSEDPDEQAEAAGNAVESASREKADTLIALQKKSSLASRLDLKAARDLRDASDERRLQPLFIQRFFERAWVACGGTIQQDDHFPVWHLGMTPGTLLDFARDRRLPLTDHYDTPYVFDKKLVSIASRVSVPERTKLMGPGHQLFTVLIEWAIRQARQPFARGTLLVDPNIARSQRIWLVRSSIADGRVESRRRLAHEKLAVIALDHMGIRSTSPSYLLNCLPPEGTVEVPSIENRSEEEIQAWAYEEITEKQLAQVKAARTEECALRRQYLHTAFTDLILELQDNLNDLQQAYLVGEDTGEEMERLRLRIEELKTRKVDRLQELELMVRLSANLPDIIAQTLVIPAQFTSVELDTEVPAKGFPMQRDDEVEAIAMEVSSRYERSRGWSPVDVSQGGEHYDIRSEGPDGEKRFIEVKGRAMTGPVVLTGPEVDKLRQLGERSWLYVVTFCRDTNPRLHIIQDPIARLHPEMLYRQVQFLVQEDDWSESAQEVEVT